VHGHSVNFEAGAKEGVYYLYYLGYDQAEEIFNKAANNGSTSFTCSAGGYKLTLAGSSYTVSKSY